MAVYVKADLSRLDQKLRDYSYDTAVTINGSFLPNSLFGLTNDFMKSAPWALKKLLKHLRVKYKNPAGYFVWSFLDVFEYVFGYRVRFGVYGVDFNSRARTRYQRHSAKWYSSFLQGQELRPVALPNQAYSQ
nr:unnamed protein product [Digitaria exilis]